ncbi:MAG: hypothetical protein Q4E03_06620 [Trueperella sp.]|nr:hypothetical protein [Trueperella sp.]
MKKSLATAAIFLLALTGCANTDDAKDPEPKPEAATEQTEPEETQVHKLEITEVADKQEVTILPEGFKINMPAGWVPAKPKNAKTLLHMVDLQNGNVILIHEVGGSDLAVDPDEYLDTLNSNGNIGAGRQASYLGKLEIDGEEARKYAVTGGGVITHIYSVVHGAYVYEIAVNTVTDEAMSELVPYVESLTF